MFDEYGKRVKELRAKLGMTQAEMAEEMGLKWHSIRDLELGKKKLTPKLMKEMEEKLSVSSHWLFTGNGEMFYSRRYIGDGIEEPPEEVVLLRNKAFESLHYDKTLFACKSAILVEEAPEECREALFLALERELFFLKSRYANKK